MKQAILTAGLAVGLLASMPAAADCGLPLSQTVTVAMPAHPFSAVATADGCFVFVALDGQGRKATGGVAMLHRNGDSIQVVRGVPLRGRPAMLLLMKADDLLMAADGNDIAFIDPVKVASGAEDALIGTIAASGMDGVIRLALTPDERTLFASNERSASLMVIDLEKARKDGFNADAVLGRIPVGRAPVGLAVSADGKYLYATSEVAPSNLNLADTCPHEGGAGSPNDHAEGILSVIDVARAREHAEQSVLAEVPAGCNPVRVALSPSGDTAYVTARGGNAVNVFATAALLADPAHARVATVPTGKSPVGMALSANGARLIVTNSDRFGPDRSALETLSIIDTKAVASGAAAVTGSIPAGAFPRELRFTADGILMVTNYLSDSVQFVPLK